MDCSRAWLGCLIVALSCAVALTAMPAAEAGHEVPYYPSFYPQEIRVERLDPDTAAQELINNKLHAYIGAAPRFSGAVPDHLKSVVSLRSFITATFNPQSRRVQSRDARCRAARLAVAAMAKHPDVVAHPYPITPYHADYIDYADLAQDAKPPAGEAEVGTPPLTFRAGDPGIDSLLAPQVPLDRSDWDIRLDEVPVTELIQAAGASSGAWLPPAWAKEGWFQAYHLLRSAVGEPTAGARADATYNRLTHGEFASPTERVNLERALVAALVQGCERTVIGYRLRREFYNDEFSNGVENIAVDSQFGFNSPIFVRTIKLKDFPWNGWLRVGIGSRATAAWNPVAGFSDALGRFVWATVGDDAFLPIPYNSRWAHNRVEVLPDDGKKLKHSVRVPADALIPQPGTGRINPVGPGTGATTKVTVRARASPFHDGSEMEPVDLLYPYALAYRLGAGGSDDKVFDPEIAAATALMRERLRGVRIVRVEESTLAIADLTFAYRSPIVEVYLNDVPTDDQGKLMLAPPWSSVPWHVLALMEAAVERGIAAFSRSEAERRRVPWLDLVRDPAQRSAMTALIKEFATAGYRPAALEDLVTPADAKARWEKLDKFVEANGHLLVTNGPYRLKSWSHDAFVFDVVRDYTYPIGLGLFNPYAYPPRALITGIERQENRVVIAADVEMAVKQQRDHRMVRIPLKRDTLRETFAIRPLSRYLIVGDEGKVIDTGSVRWEADGRFAVSLPPFAAGSYKFFVAIFLDGNTVDPAIGRISIESN